MGMIVAVQCVLSLFYALRWQELQELVNMIAETVSIAQQRFVRG